MKKALILLGFAALLVAVGNSCKKEPPVASGAAIYGTVTDYVTHDPLNGVTVTLSGVNHENKVTGSDGYYKFANLKTGSYTITVIKNGYKSDRSSGTLDKEQIETNFQMKKQEN